MAMVVQNNLNAIAANNRLAVNVAGTRKSTEKLSSGFRINRAADDAAGLAISEKMRSQLRGLNQAIRNANDGISLIQTAEGALDETHAMLKRLKELGVQAANGILGDEERQYIQDEVNRIKEEIDRIAEATEFNGIKLLNGNLDGGRAAATVAGPRYAVLLTNIGANANLEGKNSTLEGAVLTSNITGVTLAIRDASSPDGPNAQWSADGKTLTLNLERGQVYTQNQLNDLIAGATQHKHDSQTNIPADITLTLQFGMFSFEAEATFTTETGKRAASAANLTDIAGNLSQYLIGGIGSTERFADTIRFVSNNFGHDNRQIAILTNAVKGQETVDRVDPRNEAQGIKDGQFVLRLATGVEYTADDISRILAKAGLDYTVELSSNGAVDGPDGDVVFYANTRVGGLTEMSFPWELMNPGLELDILVGVIADEFITAFEALDRDAIFAHSGTLEERVLKAILAGMTAATIESAQDDIIDLFDGTAPLLAPPVAGVMDDFNSLTAAQHAAIKAAAEVDLAADPTGATMTLTDALLTANFTDMDDYTLYLAASEFSAAVNAGIIDEDGMFTGSAPTNRELDNITTTIATRMFSEMSAVLAENGLTWDSVLDAGGDVTIVLSELSDLLAVKMSGGFLADGTTPADAATFFVDDGTEFNWAAALGFAVALTLDMNTDAGAGVGADKDQGKGEGITFQIGANNAIEQRVTLNIKAMDSASIGIANFDVSTVEGARAALDNVDAAITVVSAQRAALGAMQNRLEHTVNSLTVSTENLTAAESQIRDTDMAKEMVDYTKFNILQQAAQAMLAQANQAPQAILQLLR
jgi:flagellin